MSRRSAAAPLFSALGDETRLTLVNRLGAEGPLSITQLTTETSVTRQAVTKHLSILGEVGLVHDRRRGRERLWELDRVRLEEARCYLEEISRQWDDALERLKSFVED